MRQYRGVISRAGADLNDAVARPHIDGVEPDGVTAGQADVQIAVGIERDQDVLIEKRRIVIRRLHVAGSGERRDRPRPRPGKGLASHACEGALDRRIAILSPATRLAKKRLNFCERSSMWTRSLQRHRCTPPSNPELISFRYFVGKRMVLGSMEGRLLDGRAPASPSTAGPVPPVPPVPLLIVMGEGPPGIQPPTTPSSARSSSSLSQVGFLQRPCLS